MYFDTYFQIQSTGMTRIYGQSTLHYLLGNNRILLMDRETDIDDNNNNFRVP